MLTLMDERAQWVCVASGVTPDDGSEEGVPVLELIEHSVLVDSLQEPMPVMKRMEEAFLATSSVWEPLEHLHCVVSDDVDFDYFWMAPWDAGGMLGDGGRLCVTFRRTLCRSVNRLSIVEGHGSKLIGSLEQLIVLNIDMGLTDALAVGHNPDMNNNTETPRLAVTPGEWYNSDLLATTSTEFQQMDDIPHVIGAVKLDCSTVWGFPQIDSAAVGCGTVELDDLTFRWRSFPPDEFSAGRKRDYIWLAPLAGSSVCARTVTGSLLFGSSHRLVRSCLGSAGISLHWLESVDVPQCRHLQAAVGCNTPDICISGWSTRVEMYLLLREIVLLLCAFCRAFATRAMVSDRLPCMDQVGPSYAPDTICISIFPRLHRRRVSALLPGTFFCPTLDITSEKLCDFVPNTQDAMELRAIRPTADLVNTMAARDSQSIRLVTPEVHVECGFHRFLLHEMGEEESSFVVKSTLDSLRGNWPQIWLSLMTRFRQNLERKRRECKERFSYRHSGNCEHCGKLLLTDFDKHISFCHLELAWICCCLVMWCPMWRWTTQDCRCRYWLISRTGCQYDTVFSVDDFPVLFGARDIRQVVPQRASPPGGRTVGAAHDCRQHKPPALVIDFATGKCRRGIVSRPVFTSPLMLVLTVVCTSRVKFLPPGASVTAIGTSMPFVATPVPVVEQPGMQAKEFQTVLLSESPILLPSFGLLFVSPSPTLPWGAAEDSLPPFLPNRAQVGRSQAVQDEDSSWHRFHRDSSFGLHEGARRLQLEGSCCRRRWMTLMILFWVIRSLMRDVNRFRGQNPLSLCLCVWPSGLAVLLDPPVLQSVWAWGTSANGGVLDRCPSHGLWRGWVIRVRSTVMPVQILGVRRSAVYRWKPGIWFPASSSSFFSGVRGGSGIGPDPVSSCRSCMNSKCCSGGPASSGVVVLIQILPLHNQLDARMMVFIGDLLPVYNIPRRWW